MSIISNAITASLETEPIERQSGAPVSSALWERQHSAFLRVRPLLSQSCKPTQALSNAFSSSGAHLAIAEWAGAKQRQYQTPDPPDSQYADWDHLTKRHDICRTPITKTIIQGETK